MGLPKRSVAPGRGLAGAILLCLALAGPCPAQPAAPAEILLDDYRAGLSPRWQEKSFKGRTEYRVRTGEPFPHLEAFSRGSASALYYEISYDPRQYPFLSWWWKVEGVVTGGDARRKDGDDYAARVYVVFPALFFWQTRAVSYIWANRLPAGEAVPNPFTANAVMIALRSGPEQAGRWVRETRNLLLDYRRFFGQDPPKAGAVALMTDTDNTAGVARAFYGPIRILSRPPD